jgi:hypothetical protein
LRDFKSAIAQKLEGLHEIYADKVQSIGGLCSMMSMEKPSPEDYLAWLFEEVSGLSDVFSGVNENFATPAIEGALALAAILLILKLCELLLSKLTRTFYPLLQAFERLLGPFQRNGGDRLVTTIFCLLFTLGRRRYFLIFGFWFVSHTLILVNALF